MVCGSDCESARTRPSFVTTVTRVPLAPIRWAQRIGASGTRVTVVTKDGLVLADSQSDPHTMENHAQRPEIIEALAQGSGRSIRHSATINRDLDRKSVV